MAVPKARKVAVFYRRHPKLFSFGKSKLGQAFVPVYSQEIFMDRMKRLPKASPHLIAIGPKDKENLASPDLLLKCKSTPNSLKKKGFLRVSSKSGNKNAEMIKNQINNLNSDHSTKKKTITSEDLTSTENPGEAYWEQLSESRRVALETTWKENMELHSKVMELEYENTKLKAMLAEAKTSIQLLTELLEENESGAEDDAVDDNRSQPDSDDECDASFTSV